MNGREQGIGDRNIERPENSPVDCFQRDGAGRPKKQEQPLPRCISMHICRAGRTRLSGDFQPAAPPGREA